ncbi:MAG: DUF1015 family protein [Nitriliruptor sp.]|nr:MAG: DUF1015 family protein [Nitriliruptor sp.]
MLELLPISARLVTPEHAATVVSPAYDALDEQARAARAASQPDCFLTALPSGGIEPGTLRRNRRAVDRLLREGRFTELRTGLLVVLELSDADRRLTAVIGDVDVAAYLDGRIRPHEHVRPDRVDELARYLDEVRIASSPVCVLHPRTATLDQLTREVRRRAPLVDTALPDGGELRVWPVTDPATIAGLAAAVGSVTALTIADGHHRAAAVARRVGATASRPPAATGVHAPRERRVLTALVASDELAVLPFHRRVEGLPDVTADEVAAVLAERGLRLTPLPGPSAPERSGTVHLVVAGSWWRVDIGDRRGPPPVDSLDAAVADRELIAPIATLAPGPATVPVVPVPAPLGLAALDRPDALGIALVPATMQDLLSATADGQVLPHKSTYLLPKLRSGILVVPR